MRLYKSSTTSHNYKNYFYNLRFYDLNNDINLLRRQCNFVALNWLRTRLSHQVKSGYWGRAVFGISLPLVYVIIYIKIMRLIGQCYSRSHHFTSPYKDDDMNYRLRPIGLDKPMASSAGHFYMRFDLDTGTMPYLKRRSK